MKRLKQQALRRPIKKIMVVIPQQSLKLPKKKIDLTQVTGQVVMVELLEKMLQTLHQHRQERLRKQ